MATWQSTEDFIDDQATFTASELYGQVIFGDDEPEESFADYLTDCPRISPMDKALYACDELAGFISACALVRPGGISDMKASSVKKKMKSKGFARTVNRDDIVRGAEDFGVDLTEHIQFVIDAMKPLAQELGLVNDG